MLQLNAERKGRRKQEEGVMHGREWREGERKTGGRKNGEGEGGKPTFRQLKKERRKERRRLFLFHS